MYLNSFILLLLWPFLLQFPAAFAQRIEWDSTNYPNPTTNQFGRCGMKTTASICDPDGVLSEKERYRLNHELHQLESRTRQSHAPDFCQKKGITAAMAVAKHIRGGTQQAAKDMANSILNTWRLDDQCQKSVVIVVATEDKQFWVARDPRVPVYAAEFTQIFQDQRSLFEEGNYPKALANILQQTWEKAISKQGPPSSSGDRRPSDTGGFRPAYDGGGPRDTGDGGSGSLDILSVLSKIPGWLWLVLVLVVIPLLLCCCFIYCCCCRSRGSSSPRRQQPSDIDGGEMGMGVGGRGRGGRGGIDGFLGGLGGAGLGSLASGLLSGGSRRRGAGGIFGGGTRGGGEMDGYQGGGAYPAGPYHPSTKDDKAGGLYPSAVVRDEGGGGSWK